jgi:2,5-furandicarboxylate decarboxylase 1
MAKDLRSWMEEVKRAAPEEIVTVPVLVDPKWEVTAVVQLLENRDPSPAILFEKVRSLKGEKSPVRLLTSIHSSRIKLGLTYGISPEAVRRDPAAPIAEMARRAEKRIAPAVIPAGEAPCKEKVYRKEEMSLLSFPAVTQHQKDIGPYFTTLVVAADPDTGVHNISWHRLMVKGPGRAGIFIVPRHLWDFYRRAEAAGKELPVAYILGHHPAFLEGASWTLAIEESEYDLIGAQLGEPARVTPSECWGDKLLVPADAEAVFEGVILPKVREPEGPFSEWTGYYCPERQSHVFELRAITSRREPIMVNKVMGHHPHKDRLGVYGMEATALKRIREIVPDVIALNLAGYHMQGFIQMRKRREGDAQRAAMALLSSLLQVKHVFIFDEDVDIFNPAEVLWALASRVQAGSDVEILRNLRSSGLDPSIDEGDISDGMIVDATKPLHRPFAERVKLPPDFVAATRKRLEKEGLL